VVIECLAVARERVEVQHGPLHGPRKEEIHTV